jgi:predicted metal-dependent HD superfamily phosphohydrolase
MGERSKTMTHQREAIARARRHAMDMLSSTLPPWAVYHSPRHTRQTVAACREIGGAVRLTEEQMGIVLLAAWFHDTGYARSAEGHEARSAETAARFLRREGYPQRMIARVRGCIMATRMPQRPRSLLQRVLCDADLISLGKKGFLAQNELLRQEMERREGRRIEEVVWLHRSYRFLHQHRFATRYGRTVLESGKQTNLRRLRRLIRQEERRRPRHSVAAVSAR